MATADAYLQAAYESHMKYGPARNYWNEYITESYWNHAYNVVLLAGLPDVSTSRPHSRDYIPPPGTVQLF